MGKKARKGRSRAAPRENAPSPSVELPPAPSGPWFAVAGVVGLGLGLALLVALWSRGSGDLAGPAGRAASDALFFSFGVAAYGFAGAVLAFSAMLAAGRLPSWKPAPAAAWIVFTLALAAMLGAQGGWVGRVFGGAARAALSTWGSGLVLGAIAAAALLAATDLAAWRVLRGSLAAALRAARATYCLVRDQVLAAYFWPPEPAFVEGPDADDSDDEGGEWAPADVESGEDGRLPIALLEVIEETALAPEPPPLPSSDAELAADGKKDPGGLVPRPNTILSHGSDTPAAPGEPRIIEPRPPPKPRTHQQELEFYEPGKYVLPPLALLEQETQEVRVPLDREQLRRTAEKLMAKMRDLGVVGEVVEIRPGPVVTLYEFRPGPGVKVSKIAGLADDLAMAMQALRVRIIAPIPGKDVCGIEVPNRERQMVHFREVAEQDAFQRAASKLTFALGKDIEGQPYILDLQKMPHLLIAGTTGSGKSVSVNAMVLSMLLRASPEEVRLIMVDPKMLELSPYEGIPHLLLPVVIDPKKAALALRWAVEEMERRYQLLSEQGARNITQYNKKAPEKLPFIVIMVDELADLMMVASREVEGCIQRLAQMARAAGIHLMLATQRPSTDVITGVIKANFPARISFQVASRHDSATVINQPGAENLLGAGDMLILPPGSAAPQRVHGAFVSEMEVTRIVEHLKKQGAPVYDESILRARPGDGEGEEAGGEDMSDELYDQALAVIAEMRQVSISMLQRRMRIGYNRAARMIERMEREGVVGAADGAKPRDVLIRPLGEMPGA